MRYESILDTVGNTPLVRLNKLARGLKCRIYAKLEFFNPGGSVKDRIAISMIKGAEQSGLLKSSGTIIECTSGNTGMGLALVAAFKGYKTIFTINDKQSREKIDALKALGAEVIVCPTAVSPDDPRHYVQVAKSLAQEIPDAFLANQYDNPDNPQIHYETTGPEIWRDTDGKVTHFVCCMGTCGTIIGAGKFLKEQNSNIKIIGIDPVGSLFYDFFHQGKVIEPKVYKVEGIGEDFFPKVLDFSVIDDIVQVTDKESFVATRKLARSEGIFAGGSAGSAVSATLRIAKDLTENDLIVVLIPDGGMRYLAKIYNDEWMKENQFMEAEVKMTCQDILKNKQIKKLVYCEPQEPAINALKKMRADDISQIPVIETKKIIGTVYEDDLISNILQGKDLSNFIVREIMKPPLPTIQKDATLEEITHFVPEKYPAILVEIEDGAYDVITKYDLVYTVGQLVEGKKR